MNQLGMNSPTTIPISDDLHTQLYAERYGRQALPIKGDREAHALDTLRSLWDQCRESGIGVADQDYRWFVVSRWNGVGRADGARWGYNFDIITAPNQAVAERRVNLNRGRGSKSVALSMGDMVEVVAAMLGKEKDLIGKQFLREVGK